MWKYAYFWKAYRNSTFKQNKVWPNIVGNSAKNEYSIEDWQFSLLPVCPACAHQLGILTTRWVWAWFTASLYHGTSVHKMKTQSNALLEETQKINDPGARVRWK